MRLCYRPTRLAHPCGPFRGRMPRGNRNAIRLKTSGAHAEFGPFTPKGPSKIHLGFSPHALFSFSSEAPLEEPPPGYTAGRGLRKTHVAPAFSNPHVSGKPPIAISTNTHPSRVGTISQRTHFFALFSFFSSNALGSAFPPPWATVAHVRCKTKRLESENRHVLVLAVEPRPEPFPAEPHISNLATS